MRRLTIYINLVVTVPPSLGRPVSWPAVATLITMIKMEVVVPTLLCSCFVVMRSSDSEDKSWCTLVASLVILPPPQVRCVRKHQLRWKIRRENKKAGSLVCDGHYIATYHIFSIADTYQHSTFVILLPGRGVQIGRVFAYFYFLT